MSFLDELEKGTNRTVTENGAATNRSSLDPLLDFFSLAGAMRDRVDDAVKLFEKAYHTDKQSALRIMFYLRDIRGGGQGERSLFRACLQKLEDLDPSLTSKLLPFIGEYGRWDDMFSLRTGEVLGVVAQLVKKTLENDERLMRKGESVSLLAKWLPSINATSRMHRKQAVALAESMALTEVQYRKRVVKLRTYIRLVEQRMSARQWSEIEYDKLPSQAGRKYTKAFKRHDEERYAKYLEAAQQGKAKMNTTTLYTYEVFDEIRKGNKEAANAMWANLPDWTNGSNALVLADVSGSMTGRPMSVSVSLALYFAEHNKGVFHDCFMTFSERPQVVKVVGNTLAARLINIENRDWGQNTNLEAALNAILDASRTSPEDIPKILYVISDMEFDEACDRPNATLFENAAQNYADAGIEMPSICFWNVDARQNQAPATKFDNHVTLISGLSQSTFRYVVEGKTPLQLMYDVINSERYNKITV